MNAFLLLAVLALPARAGDCIFDGDCAPRAAMTFAGVSLPEREDEPEMSRWEGAKKGASEGALLGFFAVLYPAVSLVENGFGQRMTTRGGSGATPYYGGFVLAAVIYIPALIVGAVGGLLGGAAGAAAPESAKEWDAEKTLFD